MTPTTIQDEFNARTLKTVKQAQEFAIDAIKAVSERVQPVLPKLDNVRGIENLPTAHDVVEKAFELSAELLKSAKAVALEATKAFALRETKKAPKPAAKKAPAAPAAAAS
ncbi:MAG TPA: hypothetical protein VHD87_08605 [Acidimicrobiales bacterium]|nr:hypothetical protein [Acidimicrobiales bacterium]